MKKLAATSCSAHRSQPVVFSEKLTALSSPAHGSELPFFSWQLGLSATYFPEEFFSFHARQPPAIDETLR